MRVSFLHISPCGPIAVIRTETCCFWARSILQKNLVLDDRFPSFHNLAANLLPADLDWTTHGQPDVTNDTAIVPPVVPGMFATALRQTGNRSRSNPVIDFDCDLVGRRNWRVTSKEYAVYPPSCDPSSTPFNQTRAE